METLGAYLYFNELPDLLQSHLEGNCLYKVDNRLIYCIDHLNDIDCDDNFWFYVTAEDDNATNYLGLGTDIIPIAYSDLDSRIDYIDKMNALEELRHIIKMKVVESLSKSIKKEQYITCFD